MILNNNIKTIIFFMFESITTYRLKIDVKLKKIDEIQNKFKIFEFVSLRAHE
ncbi:hypothetical protein GCM10011368_29110 [Hyunsoonleella pacifica]|nr:hypothetical protein GCM10011368_29110 [Hyunsoonleella pacifica]